MGSIKNFAGSLKSAGGMFRLNPASRKEVMASMLPLVAQGTEWELLRAHELEPDVLLGMFPLYLVNDLESGKSSKTLRFRGINGHLLAFNKGEGNTLIIKFSLVGPLAPFYLQILDMAYYYGSEKIEKQGIKTVDPEFINSGFPVMGVDVAMTGDAAGSVMINQVADDGTRGLFNQEMRKNESYILPNDFKSESVQDRNVDLVEPIVQDRTTRYIKGKGGEVHEEQNDYEMVAKRRTFTVMTKYEIFTRMYIETLLHSQRTSLGYDEMEVDLLLRKYTEPAPKTRYIVQVAGKEDEPINKKAIDRNDAEIEKLKKQLSALAEKQERLKLLVSIGAPAAAGIKGKKPSITRQQAIELSGIPEKKIALAAKIQTTISNNAEPRQARVKYTAGRGTTSWKQVVGTRPDDIVNQDAVSLVINAAWRGIGMTTGLVLNPTLFSCDPVIGRALQAQGFAIANAGGLAKKRAGAATGIDVGGNVLVDQDNVPVAPHESMSVNKGSASSTTYQQGVTFNPDPALVQVTLNGKTGVTQYNMPLVDWMGFMEFLGEDSKDATEIGDILTATPSGKQADMESTIIFACNLFKLTGAIPFDGSLEFDTPVACSFSMDIQQNLGVGGQFTPKMETAAGKFTVQPGLVYYLGTSATPTWALNEDDGLVHVNKPVLDEIYFYCKSITLAGNYFHLVGFFFYPMYGI